MYLGIDVGGTKTLFAVFDKSGQMRYSNKIKTPKVYKELLAAINSEMAGGIAKFDISHCCCAVPGWIDYEKGVAVGFGNLPWENVPVLADLKRLMPKIKVMINNDANLAGLSETILLHKKYRKVMYLTISTGIGGGIIIDDVIDPDFVNFEPGHMKFEYEHKSQDWETFASGKALFKRYGLLASEIKDPKIWKEYTKLLVSGMEDLLATIQPDAVIFGGGVGTHFDKFNKLLKANLEAIDDPLVPIPPLLKAKRPEEAVIYGCYEYIKQSI